MNSEASRTESPLPCTQRWWDIWTESHDGNTINIKPVPSRNPSTNLPPKLAIDFDIQNKLSGRLIAAHFISEGRRHRQSSSDQRGRQQIAFLVALIEGRNRGVDGDLLAFVCGVGLYLVVVNANFLIRVFRK